MPLEPQAIVSPVNAPSTATLVREHLEELILAGVLRPGEQLPPERELAKQLGVSRSVLREALKELTIRHLIRSTQGGGNFVSDLIGKQMTDPIAQLLRDNPATLIDFMEFRIEFESAVAGLAAMRATAPDVEVLSMIFRQMEQVHDAAEIDQEARLDVDFHLALAECSHNAVFIHIAQSMRNLMKQELLHSRLLLFKLELGKRRGSERSVILDHHEAILNAVLSNDADAARCAMRDHLTHVRAVLQSIQLVENRTVVAKQRLNGWARALDVKKG